MPSRLTLQLASLPTGKVEGVYGAQKNELPYRMRLLAPDAAESYLRELAGAVVVSDMFRSPESSLAAVRAGRGAQPPSRSLHNFGIAIDLDTGRTRKKMVMDLGMPSVSKKELDDWMEKRGWYCHRRDHGSGKTKDHPSDESWHYNFLGVGAMISPTVKSTSGYAEQEIVKRYGAAWTNVTDKEAQQLLTELRLYHGAIDGDLGPLSTEAIRAFQRTWGLIATNAQGKEVATRKAVLVGVLEPFTVRTLVYVTCARDIKTLP